MKYAQSASTISELLRSLFYSDSDKACQHLHLHANSLEAGLDIIRGATAPKAAHSYCSECSKSASLERHREKSSGS